MRRVGVGLHHAVKKVDAVDCGIVARVVGFLCKENAFFVNAGASMLVLIPGDVHGGIIANVIHVDDAL